MYLFVAMQMLGKLSNIFISISRNIFQIQKDREKDVKRKDHSTLTNAFSASSGATFYDDLFAELLH